MNLSGVNRRVALEQYAAWHARQTDLRGPCAPTPASPWCASAWERCGDGLPASGDGYAYGRATTGVCPACVFLRGWDRVPPVCTLAPVVAHGTWWAL